MHKAFLLSACLISAILPVYSMHNKGNQFCKNGNRELQEAIDLQVTRYGQCTVLHIDTVTNNLAVTKFDRKQQYGPFSFEQLRKTVLGQATIEQVLSDYRMRQAMYR